MTRLIPPVLFVILVAALFAKDALFPGLRTMRHDASLPWDIPLALGLGLLIWARWWFVKSDSEVHTFKTPTKLVTDGPFRFSRNPMYAGFLLLLLAAALFVNAWWALFGPLIFLLACSYWYIPTEEDNMRATFGEAYDAYRSRTRRWI